MKLATLIFEGIGQGLFYTGSLLQDHSRFDFVYDCGSVSDHKHLDQSINRYSSLSKFDLVIISHFDEDHVNGIKKLITDKRVSLLVLPYVTWVERLIVATNSQAADPDYLSMLSDPIAFFTGDDFNIDRIIIIGGPDLPPGSENGPIPVLPDETEIGKLSDNAFRMNIFGKPVEDNLIAELTTKFSGNPHHKVNFYKTPFLITSGNLWEFQFYNQESNNSVLVEKFRIEVEKMIDEEGITIRDIFEKQYRAMIRTLYRRGFGNINQTSVIVYHGPLRSWGILPYYKEGTFLTGDINFSRKKNLTPALIFFRDYLEKVSVFLVPHHAAKNNWSFSHPSILDNFEAYVFCAGLNRTHHPDKRVLEDITDHCHGYLLNCNEFSFAPYRVWSRSAP